MAEEATRPDGERKYGRSDQNPMIFADFAHVALGPDFAIHSVFQTVPVLSADQANTMLVGRFAYSGEHFKALTALFVRQYVRFESNRKNEQKAVEWLHQILNETLLN